MRKRQSPPHVSAVGISVELRFIESQKIKRARLSWGQTSSNLGADSGSKSFKGSKGMQTRPVLGWTQKGLCQGVGKNAQHKGRESDLEQMVESFCHMYVETRINLITRRRASEFKNNAQEEQGFYKLEHDLIGDVGFFPCDFFQNIPPEANHETDKKQW
jgi:hypothetical protein